MHIKVSISIFERLFLSRDCGHSIIGSKIHYLRESKGNYSQHSADQISQISDANYESQMVNVHIEDLDVLNPILKFGQRGVMCQQRPYKCHFSFHKMFHNSLHFRDIFYTEYSNLRFYHYNLKLFLLLKVPNGLKIMETLIK